MRTTRQQLTLYVPGEAAAAIEDVRRIVDPVQHELIRAHVTLCREDELGDLSRVRARLGRVPVGPITLRFGTAEAFADHGWLLRCIDGEADFRRLREYVLDSTADRSQPPHITLAHPRNPKAIGNTPDTAACLPAIAITFPTICLIEQADREPWRVVERYELAKL